MDLSELRKAITVRSAKRQKLEKQLLQFRHPMTPGSVYPQYTRCARSGCRCMKGEKHGPFFYLSLRQEGKTVMRYIGKQIPSDLKKKTERYGAFIQQLHELRKLDKELTDLWNRFREKLVVPLEKTNF